MKTGAVKEEEEEDEEEEHKLTFEDFKPALHAQATKNGRFFGFFRTVTTSTSTLKTWMPTVKKAVSASKNVGLHVHFSDYSYPHF